MLDGVWTGSLVADREYPITLRFVACEIGKACGENEYTDPDDPRRVSCASELTLTEVREDAFLLAQRMTYNAPQCLETSLLVKPAPDGTLVVEEYPDLAQPPCCTGTMQQVDPDGRPSPLPMPSPIAGLGTPTAVIDLRGTVTQYPAEAFGSLWMPLDQSGEIARIDLATGVITARVRVGDPAATELGSDPHGAAASDDGVWIASAAEDAIVLIDPATDAISRRIAIGVAPYTLAIDGERAWAVSFEDDAVVLVDLARGQVVATASVAKPTGVAVGAGGLWVVEHRADRVVHLDPDTLATVATIDYEGPGPNDVCGFCVENIIVADGSVWTADNYRRSVTRIDPRSDRITARIAFPMEVWAVAAGGGRIWAGQKDEDEPTDTWQVAAIDPATNEAVTYAVPALSVAWAGAALWTAVPDRRGDTLTRIEIAP